jgi:hypothetical protein
MSRGSEARHGDHWFAGWMSEYGAFFMDWYSKRLIKHGADVLEAIMPMVKEFNSPITDGKDWPDVSPLLLIFTFESGLDGGVEEGGTTWGNGQSSVKFAHTLLG